VSRNSKNRLLLLICDTPTPVNTLKRKYKLQDTDAYHTYIQTLAGKMAEVQGEFFGTPAMTQNNWKEALCDERHIVTRHAMHGFHHKICTNKDFHHAEPACACVLCGETASQYHLLQSTHNNQALRQYAD